jgi:hypothetical protein
MTDGEATSSLPLMYLSTRGRTLSNSQVSSTLSLLFVCLSRVPLPDSLRLLLYDPNDAAPT